MITLNIPTHTHTEMIDITAQIAQIIDENPIKNGICTLFVPHTTAALTINENCDPDVITDFAAQLNKIVPWQNNYAHCEGNSAAHIKASMMGFSEQIIIENSKLQLGIWQGIYFCEFDGARSRKLFINIMGN